MTEAAEVQRLQNLLAAETKERKKVQAEIQEMKRILQNKSPPTVPIMSPNDTSESVAMGMPRPPAATVEVATRLPPQDNSSNGNINIPNYYTANSNEQFYNNPLNKILALEQKWIASDITMNNIAADVHTLLSRVEYQEQYSKLYNLLIHGLANVPEFKPDKATEFCEWVANAINTLLPNLCKPVTADHIDHAHPMRTMKANGNVVIVRFANRSMRYVVFGAKKQLKHSAQPKVSFTEHLTSENLRLLHAAKDIAGRDNVWTDNCVVLAKAGDKTFRIRNNYSLDLLSSHTRSRSRSRHNANHHD